MTSVTVIAFMTVALAGSATATELAGVVLENDIDNGRPLPDAVVEAEGASPTRTDARGRFTLRFQDRGADGTVTVSVHLPGFVLVNDLDLDAVPLRVSATASLRIVLAKAEDRQVMARRLYRRRIVEAADADYRRDLGALRGERLGAEAVYRLRASVIETAHDLLRTSAVTLAAELANEDVPGSVEARGKALRLFSEGKVLEAVSTLDRVELAWQRARVAEREADTAAKLHQLGIQYRSEKRYAWSSMALQQALALRRTLLDRGMGDDAEIGTTLHELGLTYLEQHRAEDARKVLEAALAIRHRLVREWLNDHLWDLANTLEALGGLARNQNRLQDARNAFVEALDLYRRLERWNRGACAQAMADLLVSLGNVYQAQHRADEASRAFREASDLIVGKNGAPDGRPQPLRTDAQ